MQDQSQTSANTPPVNSAKDGGTQKRAQVNRPTAKTRSQDNQVLPVTNQQIAQSLPVPSVNIPKLDIDVPEEASDNDLIEKEWVEKAKQVVEGTRGNPYQKQEELSKMKTQYLKKRYNKEIKSLDD